MASISLPGTFSALPFLLILYTRMIHPPLFATKSNNGLRRASTCFIIYQEPFVYKDFQHFHTKQYFVWLRLFSFICHKNCHKRAMPNKGNGSDYYIIFSSFFISFCTLAASTWLYMFIVMLMSLCPMIICKTLISIAILLINANSRCAEPPFAILFFH